MPLLFPSQWTNRTFQRWSKIMISDIKHIFLKALHTILMSTVPAPFQMLSLKIWIQNVSLTASI